MRIGARRAFSAMLFPGGVHAVSYRESSRGLEIQRYFRELAPASSAAEAADRLGDLLESAGGRGGRLSLALSGFGSYHHILSLPSAPKEILLPVVQREFRRFFPDLFLPGQGEPVIDFVEVDTAGRGPDGSLRELLAAAVPRSLIQQVRGSLGRHGIELEHWTIVPRAMQRLYDAFSSEPKTDVALVLAPQSPMLGFFHEGELRLFSELPPSAGGPEATEVDLVVEQIERGALYLRQQFRGAAVDRLLLAAEPEAELRGLAAQIRERLGITVDRFGSYSESPGAMAALGAALDRGNPDALNLLPADARPRGGAEAWTHRLGVASAAVLVAGAAWWGWSGIRAEQRAEAELLQVESELRERSAPLAEIRALIGERQAHTLRAERLAQIGTGQQRLPELLWPIQEAARTVRVDELRFTRGVDGWEGTLHGTATGATSAAASGAVDRLFSTLSREFPPNSVTLNRFGSVQREAPAEGEEAPFEPEGIAIAFEMSFILPAEEGPRR